MMGFGCMHDTGCKHRDWCKDMGACAVAIDADAEKLRHLTGEDHGLFFLDAWQPIETAPRDQNIILGAPGRSSEGYWYAPQGEYLGD